jgi:hypothetical protein
MKRFALACLLSACAIAAQAQSTRWSIGFTIPEGNWMAYAAPDGWNNKFGFLGFTLEAAYAYSQSDSVSLKLGYLSDYPMPFGARIEQGKDPSPDYSGTVKHSYGFFLFLQNRYRSDFGLMASYGLALEAMTRTKLVWKEGKPDDGESYLRRSVDLGAVGGLSYISPWAIFAGAQYAPAFLSLTEKKAEFGYSHLAFFDLGFKFDF